MRTALLFPGQGSQTPNMRELVEAARPDLLALAIETVGDDPFLLVDDGTRFAQPALYCASVALWSNAGEPEADFIAGHSLGEVAALVAGGSIGAADGLRLATRRGEIMQAAAQAGPPGGMLALLGDDRAASELAAGESLGVANDNAPGQLVVCGPEGGLEAAAAAARERGLKAMRLAVRGAFHSEAMAAAVPALRAALDEIEVAPPHTPVFSSITAEPFDDVRSRLAEALVRPVRWRQTLMALERAGVERFVEVGPGRVLKGLVRRTVPDAEALTLAELEVAHA
jgi:malonyl CoA-acyl carrier protein transacylase